MIRELFSKMNLIPRSCFLCYGKRFQRLVRDSLFTKCVSKSVARHIFQRTKNKQNQVRLNERAVQRFKGKLQDHVKQINDLAEVIDA